MNKKILFYFILLLVILSYIFSIDKIVSQKLSILNTNMKVVFINNMTNFRNLLFQYFNQANTIKQLQKLVNDNEKYKALYQLKNIAHISENIELNKIKVISYINFNDFSKVLLKANVQIANISALITSNGYSAGIAHIDNNQIIGYLNHNEKSNYAVFIGNNLAPGITNGNKNKDFITVKFIPKWHYINIGDEVITSGMDNIFPKGIKVGKVIEIKELTNTKEVLVKPYANVYNKNYFYLYSKILPF